MNEKVDELKEFPVKDLKNSIVNKDQKKNVRDYGLIYVYIER